MTMRKPARTNCWSSTNRMRMGGATSVFATESPLHLEHIFRVKAVQIRPGNPRQAAAPSKRCHQKAPRARGSPVAHARRDRKRSEEHTSELQSRGHLVCRLLLEKK